MDNITQKGEPLLPGKESSNVPTHRTEVSGLSPRCTHIIPYVALLLNSKPKSYTSKRENLFPRRDEDTGEIYRRLAKEGAKYHIGMVYSTQSPTTINRDLLGQTENFFVAHLSSEDDVNMLGRVNIAFETMKDDIMRAKTVGYVRMLTRSHRFVVPIQARKFTLEKPPTKPVTQTLTTATPGNHSNVPSS